MDRSVKSFGEDEVRPIALPLVSIAQMRPIANKLVSVAGLSFFIETNPLRPIAGAIDHIFCEIGRISQTSGIGTKL